MEEPMINSVDDCVKALDGMDLTPDEVSRFGKAFKDPEFLKMFADYAKEISDPAAKAETDAYLKQVEAEGRTKEVYGDDVELITPTSGFVVKTKKKETGDKVFINVCHSDKITPATSKKVEGGSQWDVPYSLSAIRQEKDNKGNDCDTHDFVISTDTYNRCQQKVFRNFIVATAIENVQKQRYGVYEKQRSASATLDTAFTVPTLQFKGPKTGPAVLAVKDGKGKPSIVPEEGARVAPKSAPAAFNGLQVPDVAAEDKRLKEQLQQQEKQQKQQQEEQQKQKQQPAAAAGASAFDLKFKAPTPKAPPELGLVAPKYELVHRGTLDLQSAWEGTADNRVRQLENVPKALVVRVALPRLESIAGVELDVAPQRVLLNMPDMYRLDLALPFKVDDTEGKAKFDKGKRQLELVLPVVPPPPPQRAALSTPLSEGALVEEVASWEEQGEDEAVEAAPAASETSEASPQGAREAQVEAEAQAKVEIVSENERKWRETMARGDEKRRAAAAAAEAEALQAATDRVLEQAAATTAVADAAAVAPRLEGDFVATAAFGGPRLGYVFKKGDCGLGYYADAREASKYKKQLTTQTLQPAATPATPAATAAVSAPAVTEPKPASDPPVESKPALAPRLFAGDVFELD